MMKRAIWLLTLGLLALGLMSAPAFAEPRHADQAVRGASSIHQGSGKVVAVDRATLTVKLAHDPIKSLGWPGMTMNFSVASATLLDGIKAGDTVMFDLGQGGKPGQWQIIRIMPHGAKQPVTH